MQSIMHRMVNNKVLLYSIGNYVQYPVITIMAKSMKKDYIYAEILHCTTETFHCKSTILQ